MTLNSLRAEKQRLNLWVDQASKALNDYTIGKTNSMGLMLDEYKTPEYKALRSELNRAFQELRAFNGQYAKLLRKAQ